MADIDDIKKIVIAILVLAFIYFIFDAATIHQRDVTWDVAFAVLCIIILGAIQKIKL